MPLLPPNYTATSCRPSRRGLRLLLALLVSLSSGCAQYASTTRVLDGEKVQGRFIPSEAYAAYLRAAQHEARGAFGLAIMEYTVVLDHDPDSVEAQTRLAALKCRESYVDAVEAFDEGASLSSSYGPLWQERARCALLHQDVGTALTYARQALKVAPLDSVSTQVLATVLERSAQPEAAAALRLAYATRFPAETRPLPKSGSVPLERSLALCLATEPSQTCIRSVANAGVPPLRLARWLLHSGHSELAQEPLSLVIFADPENADARVLALAAALKNDSPLTELRSLKPRPSVPPSPSAARWLTQLIGQYVGAEASSEWEKAYRRYEDSEAGAEVSELRSEPDLGQHGDASAIE